MDKTEAEVELLQAELEKVRSQLVSTREDLKEVNRLWNDTKNDLWLTQGKLRLREEEVEALKAQLTSVTATASPLSEGDRATLRKMAAAELRRLDRELSESEQDLLNQDKGRRATTDEGLAKKEQRKTELNEAIAQLQQKIANLNELAQKLKS